jgi:4-diphosphocytidyl-2-C-methyl-D-erythritol kinase
MNPRTASVRIRAPAKINLFLEVLARESSGYHQLETLFCALELADELELAISGDDITLAVEGAELGAAAHNLAYRAANAYRAARGGMRGVRIQLRKAIPAGAGMGGGSSDAAATLIALERLHATPLGAERLLQIGASLGSDVPFFLCGSSLALGWGRGGRLLALDPLPAAEVLLVLPARGLATVEAFAALSAARGSAWLPPARLHRKERLSDWAAIAALAHNDFEELAFSELPELARAKEMLHAHGAAPALLTGSGSTVYGVFQDRARLNAAQASIRAAWPDLRVIRTRTAGRSLPLPFG